MMEKMLLQTGRWYGLDLTAESATVARACVSPFFVTAIVPLRTGGGLLRVSGISAFRFPRAERLDFTIKVQVRRSTYLAGTQAHGDGSVDMVVLGRVDLAWMRSRCGLLWSQWPPKRFCWWEPEPSLHDAADDYLNRAFGRDEAAILRGATESSFGCELHPMPQKRIVRKTGTSVSALDTYLLKRGFVPNDMDDKWFVHFSPKTGQLFIRRSWTGYLLFIAQFTIHGENSTLEAITINRSQQYGEPDMDVAVRLAEWIIFGLVCGRSWP